MASRRLALSAARLVLKGSRSTTLRFVSPYQAGSSAQLRHVRAITRYSSSKPQADDYLPQTAAGSSPAPGQDHLALAKPLDFDMASKIDGQESQMVTFELEPGQVIRAEAGNLVYMEDGIEMDTNTGGGMGNMFRRVITGQNMFVTDYVNRGDRNSKVGLGTDVPSKIVRLPLSAYGGAVICQRGAFLAGSHTIDIQTEFTKMMAGFFGGEGFVLQRLTGEGDAFVKASGPLIQRELREGETLRVSSGSVVAFSTSVQYDVQTIPGFKNVVFGGEGLFITKLTGPGTVFLQGLPFDRMVDQIARRIPGGRGSGAFIPVGVGGSTGGTDEGGEGGGAEAGEEAGEATAAVGDGGGMAAAAAGEESIAAASGGQGGESASDLFGDAAPSSASSSSAPDSSDSMGDGFSNTNHGFTPPPQEEPTWSEGAFSSEGDAPDGGGGEGGGDWMEGMGGDVGEEGGGVVDTLKKLYTFFGGGD